LKFDIHTFFIFFLVFCTQVIGSALADNPSLKRQNLKLIAVLAVPLPDQVVSGSNSNTDLHRVASTNSLATGYSLDDSIHNRPPLNPSSRKSSVGDEEDWVLQDTATTFGGGGGGPITLKTPPIGPLPLPPTGGVLTLPPELSLEASASGTSTPVRRISLYKSQQQPRKQKRTVVINSDTVS
jgi:hypothetical protein